MEATAQRPMTERIAELLTRLESVRGYSLITKAGLWAFAFVAGVAAQQGDASANARSAVIPAIASTAAVLLVTLIGAVVKVYTIRSNRSASETVLIIQNLRELIKDKDDLCNEKIASLEAEHMRQMDVARADRHKFRNRTQLCLSRLFLLCQEGRITREEAEIDFERIEEGNELAPLHRTENP